MCLETDLLISRVRPVTSSAHEFPHFSESTTSRNIEESPATSTTPVRAQMASRVAQGDVKESVFDYEMLAITQPAVYSSLLKTSQPKMGPTYIPSVGIVEGAKSVARLLLPRLRSSATWQGEGNELPIATKVVAEQPR
jgi:hypothetical protein